MSESGTKWSWVKSGLQVLVGTGGQALINGVVALLATRWLIPAERGEMVIALAIGSLIGVASSLGVGLAYRIEVGKGLVGEGKRTSYIWLVFALPVLAGFLTALAYAIFSITSTGELNYGYVIAASSVALAVTAQGLVWEAYYAFGDFLGGSAWSAVTSAVGLIGFLATSLFYHSGSTLLFAQMLGMMALLPISVLMACRKGYLAFGRFSFGESLSMVRLGGSSVFWQLGIQFTGRADRIVLAFFVSGSQVAVYALAVTASEFCRMLANAVGQVLTRDSAAGVELRKINRIVVATCATVIVVVPVAATGFFWLVRYLLDPVYLEAVPMFIFLGVGEVGMAVFLLYSRVIQGWGFSSYSAKLAVCGAIGSFIPVVVGAKLFGVYGVIFVIVSLYMILGLVAAVASRRLSPNRSR